MLRPLCLLLFLLPACSGGGAAVETCLVGEFDLAARLQGLHPDSAEFSPARWCVVTEDGSQRVIFSASGKSNPDMTGEFTVAYLPPGIVRIVNRDVPDVEFRDASITNEARRYRRLDPARLVEELDAHPDWVVSRTDDGWLEVRYPGSDAETRVLVVDGDLVELHTTADLPLRGRVPVRWRWDDPAFSLSVDGAVMFRGGLSRRILNQEQAWALWRPSGNESPRLVPANAWPARVSMELDTLADGVHIVRGVRTGFHHLVIETDDGLVVADAPAGWVEVPQVPPADLVPGLGISGLSENFIDFLGEHFPGTSIRAVALTHVHDDHAGGARAFAAAGAKVYAPSAIAQYLEAALNRAEMPADRLSETGGRVDVIPVTGRVTLDDGENPVVLIDIGGGPHVDASLGVFASAHGIFFQSDLHVPNSEDDVPRADRLATECWFAAWAVRNLPPDTVVVNSHRDIASPVTRLARYLDNDACAEALR